MSAPDLIRKIKKELHDGLRTSISSQELEEVFEYLRRLELRNREYEIELLNQGYDLDYKREYHALV